VNVLQTERLLLRTWKESDLLPFFKMNSDPVVMEFFPNALTEDETQKLYEKITEFMAQNGFGLYATEEKASNQFIGFIGLNRPSFSSYFTPCVEIGWRLDRRYWNRGFATEGSRACLAHGFSALGLKEIVSFTSPLNKRSIHVMEKIGMSFDSEFDHPNVEHGHPLKRHLLYKISHRQ
jgi:RimJ/RimL family protein N-acetyltransferase